VVFLAQTELTPWPPDVTEGKIPIVCCAIDNLAIRHIDEPDFAGRA
jgi:hypothetical protein